MTWTPNFSSPQAGVRGLFARLRSSRLLARLRGLPGEASLQRLENNSPSISGFFHSVPIE
jgi:hypothetical protein